MEIKRIIIGTRGSTLALWQSNWVKNQLERAFGHIDIRLCVIQTAGDKIIDTALSKIGDKGLFTREIEQQLLAGSIDLAVHSLKDLPTTLPDGLCIKAVTARQDPRDVLVSKNNLTLEQLPKNAIVFTSSLRRRAQLLYHRSDLRIADVRGNVPTRLDKLDKSDAQGLVIAAAGLKRLDLQHRITQYLDPAKFLPACGQGALAIEVRADDIDIADLVAVLDDPLSRAVTTAERAVLAAMEGGCQIPIGAWGRIEDEVLVLRAMIAQLDGTEVLTAQAAGTIDKPEALGKALAKELLDMGGRQILAQIRQALEP